jgi:uncharacterized integral membrane protein
MKKFITLLIAVPAALILVALALANRHPVRLALNPFRPDDSVLAVNAPFYAYLLLALIAGVALGGVATWFNQGHFRRDARNRKVEARRLRAETERLVRERDELVTAGQAAERTNRGQQLAVAGRR